MLRRVFAEEKASGVRDSMEEYMKRLCTYFHQPSRALKETERLEKQLSEQLTHLKNSMLHDNQMSSCSLKHWINGAAFHLQMLIHVARLKGQSTTEHEAQLQVHVASIISVLNCYQSDLEELLKQYMAYKKSTISIYHPMKFLWILMSLSPGVHLQRLFNKPSSLEEFWILQDKELERETKAVIFPRRIPMNNLSDGYVEYMFKTWTQPEEVKSYFSYLEKNIKDLIIQNDEFNMEKVLPVSDQQGVEYFHLGYMYLTQGFMYDSPL